MEGGVTVVVGEVEAGHGGGWLALLAELRIWHGRWSYKRMDDSVQCRDGQ